MPIAERVAVKLAQLSPDIRESQGPLWRAIKNQYTPFNLFFGPPSDPRVVAALVIKGFMSLLGILFLLYVVYAGFMWMTANGDEERIRKAKSTITTGAFGVLVILAAYSIAQFITTAFGCATATYGEWCLFFNNLTW
ncbi:MAG: hypothetical protein G01um101431_634 [Parcubacteria group bacterium Gr01-1014_31]|nr:MAG: hypothetical protein G01um101431_634 [Parcubacteria group bacterium Gr01-1014_31]